MGRMPLSPAPRHVDEEPEGLLVGTQRGLGLLYGLLETDGLGAADAGRLYEHHLVDTVGRGLEQERGIVAHHLRVAVVGEPGAHEDMPLEQHQQGMYARRLHARGKEQGGVHAGGELLGEHAVGQAHTLAVFLERGRGCAVDDALGAQGLVDGGHLRPYPVGVLRLVFVKGTRARELLQVFGSIDVDTRHRGGIGGDEGRQHLGQHAGTGPLVEGQQAQGIALREELRVGCAHLQQHLGLDALGQRRQLVDVGFDLQLGHVDGLACGQHLKHGLGSLHHLAGERYPDLVQRLVAGVL